WGAPPDSGVFPWERHPQLEGPDAASPCRFASRGVRNEDDTAAAAPPSSSVPALPPRPPPPSRRRRPSALVPAPPPLLYPDQVPSLRSRQRHASIPGGAAPPPSSHVTV
ncbi:unnamed protein product, partial [Urochloa humidicola]